MVTRSKTAQLDRTLEMATQFLDEMRHDVERAAVEGVDTPPRLRSVHEKFGHATAEYRTLVIPVAAAGDGVSPAVLSALVARYAAERSPNRLLLALEAMHQVADGEVRPVLIAEARDEAGTRLFWMQPYRIQERRVEWEDPIEGGWQDPGEDEMILDAAYPVAAVHRRRQE